jgi:hypothetical protein
MNSLIEPVEFFLDGSISQVRIKESFKDHDSLVRGIGEAGLQLSDLFPDLRPWLDDPQLTVHPTIRHQQGEDERDPVSSEYILHMDGTCIPQRPASTIVVARKLGEGASATRFVSTTGFLALATERGIFNDLDPASLDAVFGRSAYYAQAQSYFLALKPQNKRLQTVIKGDLKNAGVTTREELINKLDTDEETKPRRFPLIAPHSVTQADSIMIDAGVRHIGLATRETASDSDKRALEHAFIALRLLLADKAQLKGEGISAEVQPRTGYGIAFSKETLHHQIPPAHDRAQRVRRQISVIGLIPKAA